MNWDKPVPLVVGRGWPALWQIRALGRAGIPVVHAWISRNDPAMFSRYAHHIRIPTSEIEARHMLEKQALKTKNGMFLFDRWPEWEFLHDSQILQNDCPASYWILRNKAATALACQEAGVPTPKTFRDTLPGLTDFPWVLKPCVKTVETRHILGAGVRFLHTKAEAENLIHKVPGCYILQEWISGGPERLITVATCSDKNGRVVASFCFRKIRQYPANLGTIVVGETHRNQEAIRLTCSLLNYLGYIGLANTEFKLDPKDGRLKLLEVNPRLGKSHGFAVMCGVNLPLIRYKDFIGETLPDIVTPENGILWADLAYDFKNCFVSHKKMYNIELRDWLSTFLGKNVYPAIWAPDDPLPTLVHLKNVWFQ